MTKYFIVRTATRNPDIKGRTLYLTWIGFWSLGKEHAREFDSRAEAEKHTDGTVYVEVVEK